MMLMLAESTTRSMQPRGWWPLAPSTAFSPSFPVGVKGWIFREST